MKNYYELTKPRITWLILVTTGVGYYFGHKGVLDWLTLFHCMVGTALIASGTSALNQWYEHQSDALMRRTEKRPIPAGAITPRNALIFGFVLSCAGYLQLSLGCNWLTAALGLITECIYLFVYTPLKQRTPISTTIGAVPGAMPPLIGFAAASGHLTLEAWALFAIMFLWQFPHFYAIAWMYREDYQRGGIRMLPVVEPDGESTVRQMMLFSLALIPVTLLPRVLSMTGNWYVAGAVIGGFVFFWYCTRMVKDRSLLRARSVLLVSVIYLPVLFGLLILDRPH